MLLASNANDGESNELELNYVHMLKAYRNQPCPIDIISRQGKFSWMKIGNVHIPVLFRHEIAVVSVYLLETEVFHDLFSCIQTEVCKLPLIYCTQATETEANLLNHINIQHSNRKFGSYIFTSRDILITKKDALLYYDYLNFVFEKIISPKARSNRCGFVLINTGFIVPYIVDEHGTKFVPIFYFKNRYPLLKATVVLDSWEYCYLKVCTLAQGIRSCFYPGLFTPVVPLKVIKDMYNQGADFTECCLSYINLDQLTFVGKNCPSRPCQWYLDPVNAHVFQILSEPIESSDSNLPQEEE
ncbi:uncharacterized protein LOC106670714 [Cimex lectularius]|uniref:Uncharacterized protein n=1 Tax=Cimex lectularius TaxID=79782 RepID=A0A8I6S2C1_CIMLE|nr:uncharacterized protein LOC106670714 [Cimex lectularius]